jgi:hypothetical protein
VTNGRARPRNTFEVYSEYAAFQREDYPASISDSIMLKWAALEVDASQGTQRFPSQKH